MEKIIKIYGIVSLVIFISLWLSQPVNIKFNQINKDLLLNSFIYKNESLINYYKYLEKDTLSYKLLIERLKGEEKIYFLQMRPFISEIVKASQKTGIPIASLASCIKRESQFDPHAVSDKGAYGLMGVTIWAYQDVMRLRHQEKWINEALREYGNFSWEDVKNNPELNIIVGAVYYKFLLNKLKDPTLAFLAYNWGIGNVRIMQEKYGDTKNILNRLKELASWNSAWIEPAEYTKYISRFETVFQKIEKKIEMTYTAERRLWENLAFSAFLPVEDNGSS